FPFRIDDRVALGRKVRGVLDDGRDVVAFDFDGGIRDDLSCAGIDRSAVDDNSRAGRRGQGGRSDEDGESGQKKTFHIYNERRDGCSIFCHVDWKAYDGEHAVRICMWHGDVQLRVTPTW